MTPATKTKPKTKSKTAEIGARARGLSLPDSLDLPTNIAAANQAAIEAAVALTEAEAAQAEAAREHRGSALADQAAARAAVEAGETVVHLTAATKAERVKATRARAQAAEKLVSQRARELRKAIRDDPSYLADREAAYLAASEEMAEALQALPDHWFRLLESRATYRPAKRITEEAWSGPVFDVGVSQERLTQRIEKELDARRKRGGRDLPGFEEAIATLLYHLERRST